MPFPTHSYQEKNTDQTHHMFLLNNFGGCVYHHPNQPQPMMAVSCEVGDFGTSVVKPTGIGRTKSYPIDLNLL